MKWIVNINLFVFLIVIVPCSVQANEVTRSYIEQYKHIAINEMNRVGIPASIKMAQAILESSSGKSTLARQSNNHFGIKCGRDWEGPTVYREDDDYENGLLIRSCFRAYKDPAASFIAHSDFLTNNRSDRYKFLFDLDRYDYKAWAKGLKKAGYATDPKYPSKLITVIEKYELYLLDYGLADYNDDQLAQVDTGDNKRRKRKEAKSTKNRKKKSQQSAKDQPVIIASNVGKVGSHRYARSGVYTFQKGDRLVDVARRLNMPVEELRIRNRIPNDHEPLPGTTLVTNSYVHLGDGPAHTKPLNSEGSYLWEEEFVISGL